MPPGRTIALVDDDLSVRRALPRLLRSAGYESRAFASAQELIDSGFAADAACLVIDIHLGRVSGFELLERLRALGVTAPAIFITAFDEADLKVRAQRLDAKAFLRKPFDGATLIDAIAQAIPSAPLAAGGESRKGPR